MAVKLGVNIDHVATLRQARKSVDPDPIAAAKVARTNGADLIVCHLRADRRHVQDADVLKLRGEVKTQLHLEMADTPEMVAFALKAKPDSVCFVPESPKEVTTEGGLNLKQGSQSGLEKSIKKLTAAGIGVSIFVDPDAVSVRIAKNLGADTVELCTTSYAGVQGKLKQNAELEKLELAAYLAHELGLELHAGHDLDYHNVQAVARIPHMECLNIGFAIMARSMFTGLRAAVGEMKKLIASAR
ncbi:MAG: pyridoxine 5'-phosphate synthase [Elusimicrobia bacterium]|nr:pyridoxine 5'-phosphate synthase [Elusimicrobiota bacterium]